MDEAHHLLVVVEKHGEGRDVLFSVLDPEFVVLVSGVVEKPGGLSPILVNILQPQAPKLAEAPISAPIKPEINAV